MKHMKLHESFFEGIARVCLTTENTEAFWRTLLGFWNHRDTEAQRFWGGALLGCFTRRREDAKVGGRVSPRAAFCSGSLAEHRDPALLT